MGGRECLATGPYCLPGLIKAVLSHGPAGASQQTQTSIAVGQGSASWGCGEGEGEERLLWCNFREMERVRGTGLLTPYSDFSKEGMGVPNTHSHFLLLTLNRGSPCRVAQSVGFRIMLRALSPTRRDIECSSFSLRFLCRWRQQGVQSCSNLPSLSFCPNSPASVDPASGLLQASQPSPQRRVETKDILQHFLCMSLCFNLQFSSLLLSVANMSR